MSDAPSPPSIPPASSSLSTDRPSLLSRLARRLRAEWLLCTALVAAAVLAGIDPQPWQRHAEWLDLHALAGLFALLGATQAMRDSGFVQQAAAALVERVGTLRSLALALVAASALASMLLTNDASLFLAVPLTLALSHRSAGGQALPIRRLVIFEAFAVNAGSMLSPIGNPQNLLLWQRSGVSMAGFVGALLPAFCVGAVALGLLTWVSFPGRPLDARTEHGNAQPPAMRQTLAWTAAALLLGTAGLLQYGLPGWAAAGVALVLLAMSRVSLLRVDWALLATFAALFAALGHLAAWAPARALASQVPWQQPDALYLAGVALSQLISNVPATVFLLNFTDHWQGLAVAVNVGGYGVAIGSMANLIAMRLEGSGRIWADFHLWSLPFLLAVALATWWLAV